MPRAYKTNLQRRVFELIAATITEEREAIRSAGLIVDLPTVDIDTALDSVAVRFANKLQDTNPLFDRNKFLRAAGVEGRKGV